jgi:hypothetical protein
VGEEEIMRQMSVRYREAAHREAARRDGWDGPATRRALEPRLAELHGLGLTAKAAGNVLGREYALHSSREMYAELAGR